MNSKFIKFAISAFLVINAAGWVFMARSRANAELTGDAGEEMEQVSGAEDSEPVPLSLQAIKQVNIDSARIASIELSFNAEPDTNSVASRLSLSSDGASVPFSVIGSKDSKMTIRTEGPVKTELVTVTLGKGATGPGSIPLEKDVVLGCPLSPLFAFREAKARQYNGRISLLLEFNKFVQTKDVAEYITFDPPVAASIFLDSYSQRWSWDDGYGYYALEATGDFAASTTYKVTVAEGLKAKDGSAIASAQTKSVTTPDFSPSVDIPVSGRYLAPSGDLLLPVSIVNVTNVSVGAERMLPENIVQFVVRQRGDIGHWWAESDETCADLLTVPLTWVDFPVSPAKNEKKTVACSLRKSIGAAERGVFLVSVHGTKHDGRCTGNEQRLVCISDIGISALRNQKDNETAVWITSLSTGKSMGGVEVMLFSNRNELIGKGVSDESGLFKITVPKDKDLAVVIAKSRDVGDMSFLPIENNIDIPGSAPRGNYLDEDSCEAYVFTDRGIFRPGETVFIQMMVRDGKGAAPASFPLELTVRKPNNDLFKTITVVPDKRGVAKAEVEIPEFLPTGKYWITLSLPGKDGKCIGRHSFTVESFVPPQIRVAVNPGNKVAVPGGKVSASVSAEHLYGAPAEGLKAKVRVVMQKAEFAPAGWEKYVFGNPKVELNNYKVTEKSFVLDADGKGAVAFEIPADLKAPSRAKANVQGEVIENGGRSVYASGDILVDTAPYYLGIARDLGRSVELDSEITLPWAAVAADGTPVTNAANVKAKLVKIDSHWNFTTDRHGATSWHCEHVETVVFKDVAVPPAGVDGRGRYTFSVSDYGDYRLELSDATAGTSAVYDFWASWWANGVSPSALDTFSKLELTTDKKEYASGEQARITVTAPFTGDLRLVIMREKILNSLVIPMTNKTMDVIIPVSELCAPNIHLIATLVRETKPEEIWAPHRALGTASIKVLPPENVLNVAVEVPEIIRPATATNVIVRVAGKDVTDARVTLLAVDDGICGLTAMTTPDPNGLFFAERNFDVRYFDVYARLMQVTDEKLTGFVSHIGGDEDAAQKMRLNPISARRFKPVSLKFYDVAVENGVAVIPVAVPEFTGSLRFMAIAWTAKACGSASAKANVRRNVVVQTDMPRMLAPGDKSQLSISVNNMLKEPAQIGIGIACEGPVSVLKQPGGLALPAGSRKNLTVPVIATDGIGVGKVVVAVSDGDTGYTEEIEIPVRPAAPWQVRAKTTVVPAGGSVVFEPQTGIIEATASQKFELLPSPAADIRSAFFYLRGYPYGCLEQTTSGAYPYLAISKLPGGYFDQTELEDASGVINAALARLFTMCRRNGFAMWPESGNVVHFETLYALQFVAEAWRLGYGKELVAAYNDNIWQALAAFSSDQFNYRDKCYAALDFALFGAPDKPLMSRLREKCGKGSVEARALLARAYLLSGEPAVAAEILKGAAVTKDIRSAAALLGTLSQLNPADARCAECVRIINEALDKRCGHWGTTQGNAIAINALAAYISAVGDQKAQKTVSATLKVLAAGNGQSIVFPQAEMAYWRSREGQGNAKCEIANTGAGPLYVRHETQAVPKPSELPPVENGLRVSREYFTRDGKPTDIAKARRGEVIVVKLTVGSPDNRDNVVVEDLLPSCLEIENGNMLEASRQPWFQKAETAGWVVHYEARDDRLLLFANVSAGISHVWYYQVRVVSAGEYVVPAIQASAMYEPDVVARGKASTMKVDF